MALCKFKSTLQINLGSRLCASTLIVYYEDKEIKLGIQRSCAAEDRDQNIRDGTCNTKTVYDNLNSIHTKTYLTYFDI